MTMTRRGRHTKRARLERRLPTGGKTFWRESTRPLETRLARSISSREQAGHTSTACVSILASKHSQKDNVEICEHKLRKKRLVPPVPTNARNNVDYACKACETHHRCSTRPAKQVLRNAASGEAGGLPPPRPPANCIEPAPPRFARRHSVGKPNTEEAEQVSLK